LREKRKVHNKKTGKKMKCPKCGSEKHKVSDTDPDGKFETLIERVRYCKTCSHSWTTQETEKIPVEA